MPKPPVMRSMPGRDSNRKPWPTWRRVTCRCRTHSMASTARCTARPASSGKAMSCGRRFATCRRHRNRAPPRRTAAHCRRCIRASKRSRIHSVGARLRAIPRVNPDMAARYVPLTDAPDVPDGMPHSETGQQWQGDEPCKAIRNLPTLQEPSAAPKDSRTLPPTHSVGALLRAIPGTSQAPYPRPYRLSCNTHKKTAALGPRFSSCATGIRPCRAASPG
ncbi:conserved protein of unknown function [Ectopseudomonas oleovorans]|uniref:Uncharacterized protein n=1 Tax=Ectopseudomonas oleovorans TaxID=301 RepID=A0A653AYT1_ECTOL|nr:conserved protein of unknown function [Pseudomonas oleovorans]